MTSRPVDRYPAALHKRWLFVVLALSVALAGFHHFGHTHELHGPDTALTAAVSNGSIECCLDADTPQPTPCLSVCAGVCSACVPIIEYALFGTPLAAADFPPPAKVHARSYRSAPFRPPRFA